MESMVPSRGGSIVTRSMWFFNLEIDFELIRSVVASYPLISMDTEFPGVVFQSDKDLRQAENNYAVLKANVDNMHMIQVGLTLSDSEGNLPSFGTNHHFIWEFNFREFNLAFDLHAPQSIAFLQRQGIDFEKNRKYRVDIMLFVEHLMSSRMVCNNEIQWITFHGAYDFGYLVKALSRRFLRMQPFLPINLSHFLQLFHFFFGDSVYDVKHLIKFSPNLYGGLDRVSQSLGLNRAIGHNHQAGSDSLLTLHVFNKIKNIYFHTHNHSDIAKYKGVLYGLELV